LPPLIWHVHEAIAHLYERMPCLSEHRRGRETSYALVEVCTDLSPLRDGSGPRSIATAGVTDTGRWRTRWRDVRHSIVTRE
jgi:hypothetical protein